MNLLSEIYEMIAHPAHDEAPASDRPLREAIIAHWRAGKRTNGAAEENARINKLLADTLEGH